ncbi:MAG TPA: hypothetical protein VKB50_29510 [Vicinamibacterales bacterium]|nr:hypothetical protein [Vicinamibacterales bacterium]
MTIVPLNWYSWNFDLLEGTRRLARLDLSSWRERGVLSVEGINHRVYREGAASGDFVVARDGLVLARATKPSAFRAQFVVSWNGREYTLRRESIWRRTFVLLDGDTKIGSLVKDSAWKRNATIELPKTWPLPIRVFVIWLALIIWKRDANAAGGG